MTSGLENVGSIYEDGKVINNQKDFNYKKIQTKAF
jgi:hypothetical protein